MEHLVWALTALIVAALVKHEFMGRRNDIANLYDRELSEIARKVVHLGHQTDSLRNEVSDKRDELEDVSLRLEKLSKQVNGESLSKKLGR